MSYGPRPWQQTNWDWRAATNFMLGGTGAGLMFASVFIQDPLPYPVLVAMLLIGGGLAAAFGLRAIFLITTGLFFLSCLWERRTASAELTASPNR